MCGALGWDAVRRRGGGFRLRRAQPSLGGMTRLDVFFGEPGPDDAQLREGRGVDAPGQVFFTAGHRAGCACCGGRTGAGIALQRLLHARARGECVFFSRVAVRTQSAQGRNDVLRALADDPLAATCFRLSPPPPGD